MVGSRIHRLAPSERIRFQDDGRDDPPYLDRPVCRGFGHDSDGAVEEEGSWFGFASGVFHLGDPAALGAEGLLRPQCAARALVRQANVYHALPS